MENKSAVVIFKAPGLGLLRDEIVKKMRYPNAGVMYVDEDVIAIKHARLHQVSVTKDELEKKFGISVEIGGTL